MKPCPACSCHVRAEDVVCPHCGASGGTALPAAVVLMGLLLTGCPVDGNKDAVALYGVAVEDADGDGFDTTEDCDDTDPDVNPDAEEIAGDGIDSNCDGDLDT